MKNIDYNFFILQKVNAVLLVVVFLDLTVTTPLLNINVIHCKGFLSYSKIFLLLKYVDDAVTLHDIQK